MDDQTGSGRPVDARGATGVQVGDNPQMHLHLDGRRPPWWTRSGYIEQVRDIAPGGGRPAALRDRAEELAELARFSTGDEEYLWWKAGPWAGKSALLSTFVLNPLPQVEVVSFFVTARLAAQSDSTAFTDALIDQLSAIVGESVPSSLSPAARDAHRRALLRAAIERLHGEGRRLILVVDGLDEDRGGRPGSGLASVASLLPKVCGEGLRVVVASRPNPRLPGDVPTDHPLRRGCRVRELAVSGHATRIADLAGRELRELLHGDQVHQDVLGLITACGGGLGLAELEELTGLPPYRLEGLFGGVFGRTVAHSGADSLRLYLFAHETLRETAVRSLGAALGTYRDRLHSWAERYRRQNWPSETPQYLLRGYTRMLADVGDTERLVALAVDPARHDRMLGLSGGDAAALAEIKAAQDLVLAQPEPSLLAMARLSMHRDDLETRNANIPIDLPAVWVTLGQPTRAESLANGITDPELREDALHRLVRAACDDPDRAEAIARTITDPDLRAEALTDLAQTVSADDPDRAEDIARTITEPYWQIRALIDLARTVSADDLGRAGRLAREADAIFHLVDSQTRPTGRFTRPTDFGDPDPAEAIARRITDPLRRTEILTGVIPAVSAGDPGRAARLAGEAEAIASTIPDPFQRTEALVGLIRAVSAGDPDRAARMTADAETIAHTIPDPRDQAKAWTSLAEAAAAAGNPGRAGRLATDAEAIARTIIDPDRQALALTSLVRAVSAVGDHHRAEAISHTIAIPDSRALALISLVRAVSADDPGRAGRLATDAEAIAHTITDPVIRALELHSLVQAVSGNDPDRAEVIARTITDPDRQARALVDVVRAVSADDPGRAGRLADDTEAIARTLTDPRHQAEALTSLVRALCAYDRDRASRLADDTEAIAYTITNPHHQGLALAGLVEAVSVNDSRRAEAIAYGITHLGARAQALTSIIRTVSADDPDRAGRLTDDTVPILFAITAPYEQGDARTSLVRAVSANDPHRAEEIAHTFTDWDLRARALTHLAELAAAAGDRGRAGRLADEAEAIANTHTSPGRSAETMTGLALAISAVDPDRAEAIARTITDPGHQIQALTDLIRAVSADDPDRAGRLAADAEAIAHTVTDPHWLAPVLVDLAAVAGLPRARHLLAKAFAVGPWFEPLPVLVEVLPDVILQIAAELCPSDPPER